MLKDYHIRLWMRGLTAGGIIGLILQLLVTGNPYHFVLVVVALQGLGQPTALWR